MSARKMSAALLMGLLLALSVGAATASADQFGGRVYRDMDGDGTFSAGDIALENVQVSLEPMPAPPPPPPAQPEPLPEPQAALTDMEGNFQFQTVPAGMYRVAVLNLPEIDPKLNASQVVVDGMPMPLGEPTQMPAAEVSGDSPDPIPRGIEFPTFRQTPEDFTTFGLSVVGFAFDNGGFCNGTYEPEFDSVTPPGRRVRLTYLDDPAAAPVFGTTVVPFDVAGAPLQANFQIDGAFDAFGLFDLVNIALAVEKADGSFGDDVEFEVAVEIVGLNFLDYPTIAADCTLASVSGRVFGEAAPGDGTYDDGTDTPRGGLTVTLTPLAGGALTTPTAADGTYAFEGLANGGYTVSVAGTGEPTDPSRVVIVNGAAATADFALLVEGNGGGDDDCTKEGCIRGHLHEIVLEGDVWVGSMAPASVDVSAALHAGCGDRGNPLAAVDLSYAGAFPGAEQGLDGVLAIEDVRMSGGWATIGVRVTAAQGVFADGRFGSRTYMLAITLNGRTHSACMRLRCERTTPGSRVGCYRVLDTWSWVSWADCTGYEVEPPAPCPRPAPCPTRCKSDKSAKSQKSEKSCRSGKSDKSCKKAKSKKRSRKSSSCDSGKSRKQRKRCEPTWLDRAWERCFRRGR